MDSRFGYYILVALVFGALLGGFVGAGNGNTLTAIGALIGVFIGWFVAAAVLHNKIKQ